MLVENEKAENIPDGFRKGSWKSANGYYTLKHLKGFLTSCLGDLIMFSERTKIGLILALILLTVLLSLYGCAADAEISFTALNGSVDKGSQTSLSAGHPARD